MLMSWIWCAMVAISCICASVSGKTGALAAAVPNGAQAGITLAISMAGSICLWTGVGKLMEHTGITGKLAKLFHPLLCKIFPAIRTDSVLENFLCANVCANFLGMGNAATPMGIQAAKRMAQNTNGIASNGLCRLIVLNTASIQLIPSTVAAVRASLGCKTPFDILPCVWITSCLSAGLGLTAAWCLGKVWPK